MIISHTHKFIFIKTMRTGSSSVEIALAKLCGPDDIITPTREDLAALRGQFRAQNYRLHHPLVPKRRWWKRLLRRPEQYYHPSIGYYEHIPAWRVRAYLDADVWNSYFKFTFERNPWERQVSYYLYKSRLRKRSIDFDKALSGRRSNYIPNYDLYSHDGDVIVDFVGRYERLGEEFEQIVRQLGIRGPVELPHVNVSGREGDYRSFYNDRTRSVVANWYRREIALMNYAF